MKKYKAIFLVFAFMLLCIWKGEDCQASGSDSLTYRTHVQTYGWQGWKEEGAVSGTSGQAKRLEAIQIKLSKQSYDGKIQYRTHVQTYGWQGWKENGAVSGTSGQAKRLEAIQIKLTDEMEQKYDIYYRVHAQTFGWMGWAKNGDPAGTAGYAKRLEAIQIKLVEKGGAAPGSTENAYRHPLIQYNTHVQTYGWQGQRFDGEMAGTSGQAKRLEAIQIKLPEQKYAGKIQYRTHVQTYGWQGWKENGAVSGTSGQAKRLEAIQIKLTDKMAENYDIYYRVHAQTFGWMGWAKNGDPAGTSGYAKRLEAIQIQLVNKGGAAPGSTENAYSGQVPPGTPSDKPEEPETPETPDTPVTDTPEETPDTPVTDTPEETPDTPQKHTHNFVPMESGYILDENGIKPGNTYDWSGLPDSCEPGYPTSSSEKCTKIWQCKYCGNYLAAGDGIYDILFGEYGMWFGEFRNCLPPPHNKWCDGAHLSANVRAVYETLECTSCEVIRRGELVGYSYWTNYVDRGDGQIEFSDEARREIWLTKEQILEVREELSKTEEEMPFPKYMQ
ncbi:MAG TPA: hypothetical protein H9967_09045 [Candidatus Dorea faecipullorum]|nr:hypothetical protein [Candidatus Dorea faecipullorum]